MGEFVRVQQRWAFVLPRFDASIGGGAETLVGSLAMELAACKEFAVQPEIEIWATCAKDHRTWANHFPEGAEQLGNLCVRRFPVDERDLEVFISAEHQLQQGRALSPSRQLDWLENSVNSKALYRHIHTHGQSYDAMFFAPYLFATSFWGAMIYPERSVLLPCLHDEAYAYFEVFQHVFHRVRGLIFNAEPEQALAERLYGTSLEEKSSVVGMGFEPKKQEVAPFKGERPYLLFSGRKETGKNLDLLLEWYRLFRQRGGECDLHLIGSGSVDFCEVLPDGVRDFGFVSEDEKLAQMKGATALVQLSTNESFSIVLMEAWLCGTPVIVHADCPVTKDHVVKSGGGLFVASGLEFCGGVSYLLEEGENRDNLARAGEAYVRTQYSWSAVIHRFISALEKAGLLSQAQAGAEDSSYAVSTSNRL